MNPMKPIRTLALTTLLSASLLACTAAHAALAPNAAGDEITDSKTGLIWKRCPEGMAWAVNTCTGTAARYTHEQALARATAQAGTAGWRLPNVKELSSIVDISRKGPAIDTAAFPATPSSWFWTSSPYVGNQNFTWDVHFNIGAVVYSNYRGYTYHVRLVR
jgi:Protein of unknown function (DUF1566)